MTAPLWQPPEMPGIGRSEALWNAILSHAGAPLPLAGGAHLVFTPAAAPDAQSPCTTLRFGGGGSAHVVWRAFPFAGLFGAPLAIADFPVLPPALREALIEGMVDFVHRALPAGIMDDAVVAGSGTVREPPGGDVVWFDLQFSGLAPDPVALTLGCARARLLALAAGHVIPAVVQAQASAAITVPAAFTLGASELPMRELARLRTGTVILLPATPPDRLLLRIEKTLWEFRSAGEEWVLAGRRERPPERARRRLRETVMTEETAPADRAADDGDGGRGDGGAADALVAEGVRLSDLAIAIDFDIGERDFTLAEIETWQPGAVVALDPPALAGRVGVTLRANGRAVATGDLISIDDRLAVRLSTVLLRP
ncbi:MAG: FliM/FliN family flagellar motor switch protein [Pseudochelatococcus sp.]|uniref:FliM/FliN family flagellar motor switch protein n=1 Tax=Pseudochelatococcus sp. TaxID=2020869 RepID=UPI003D9488C2